VTRLFATLALLTAACGYSSYGADASARDASRGGEDAGPPPAPVPPTDALDLLVVVDNSGSMTEEQSSFAFELPRLFEALLARGLDVHVGVVTSDMGTGGFTVPTCPRSDFGDDGILRTEGRIDFPGCSATYPRFLASHAGIDPGAFADDVACVSLVSTNGCGFEQQLEAGLKALSPRAPTGWTGAGYEPPSFFRRTAGHGDRDNAGFVRAVSVLAVVVLSDEEDCSASDPELFYRESETYGGTDLNLRCFAHADDALHPLARYVDGLLQLRDHPSRLVFAPIVGLPTDLEPAPGTAPDWPRLISEDPLVRDDRMEERVDPAMPSRLQPSCNVPGRGVAFPPVRILRVAERLQRRGAHVAIGSICQESFATPIDSLIAAITRATRGRP